MRVYYLWLPRHAWSFGSWLHLSLLKSVSALVALVESFDCMPAFASDCVGGLGSYKYQTQTWRQSCTFRVVLLMHSFQAYYNYSTQASRNNKERKGLVSCVIQHVKNTSLYLLSMYQQSSLVCLHLYNEKIHWQPRGLYNVAGLAGYPDKLRLNLRHTSSGAHYALGSEISDWTWTNQMWSEEIKGDVYPYIYISSNSFTFCSKYRWDFSTDR